MRNHNYICIITSIVIAALVISNDVNAQRDYLASQYNFNALMLNPAYAGAHPYFQASAMYRNQWSIEGAPTAQVLCADGLIPKSPVGVGLLITSDKIGIVTERTIAADVSYHLRTHLGKLSFGLRAGHVGYSAALTDLTYWDLQDEVYNSANPKEGFMTLGFGAFFKARHGNWFGGISMPSYFARDNNLRPSPDERFYKRHFYAYGGGIISVDKGFVLKPSVLIRHMEASPILVDLNLHALFFEQGPDGVQVWIGAGYRTSSTYLLSIEAKLHYNLRLGYSYDFAGRNLNQYLGSTHEIQLGFNFGGSTTLIQNPRYF